MPYLGNVPAENYAQVSYQDLTGGSGTSFTLDYPVGSAGEIEVFVNNVRQEPTVAYTVNGTALTMTGSVAATDDFYIVFQGKAEKSGTIPEKQTDGTYVFPDAVDVTGTVTSDGLTVDGNSSITGDLTVDTNTLYVDSTNNRVGIGTSSPSNNKGSGSAAGLHLYTNAASPELRIQRGGGADFSIIASTTGGGANLYSSHGMSFWTNSTDQSVTIDSTGKVGIGRTDPATYVDIYTALNSVWGERVRSDLSGTQYFITFEYGGSSIGSIQGNNTSTSYNTTSDYRLKENIVDLTGASDRVNQIPVHRFNFISDPDKTVDGFLAHEVQAVVPEAVTGTQDGMKDEEYEVTPAVLDDDGNVITEAVMGTRSVPDYQGIDQSKLVPLITAALREALAKIETLETEMTSVKARLDALETS
jgi:hypothetical protein